MAMPFCCEELGEAAHFIYERRSRAIHCASQSWHPLMKGEWVKHISENRFLSMAEAGEEIIVSESGNATEYEIEHDDSIRTESLHSLQFSADNSQDAIYSGTSDIRTMKSIEIAKELTMGCPFALVG